MPELCLLTDPFGTAADHRAGRCSAARSPATRRSRDQPHRGLRHLTPIIDDSRGPAPVRYYGTFGQRWVCKKIAELAFLPSPPAWWVLFSATPPAGVSLPLSLRSALVSHEIPKYLMRYRKARPNVANLLMDRGGAE